MRPALQAVVVAALTLAVCEVGLRAALRSDDFVRTLGRGSPAARRVAQLEKAMLLGSSAAIGVPLVHDPELGWTLGPSHVETPLRITVNSLGLRSGVPVDPRVAFDGQRVAVVGDSFAFGSDVHDEDTFAAVLGRGRPDRQVLNYGVIGYGDDQAWLRTRRDVLPHAPDVVILPLLDCDLYRNLYPFTVWFKPEYALRDGGLARIVAPPATEEIGLSQYRWTPRLFDAWSITGEWLAARRGGVAWINANTPEATDVTTAILQAWVGDVTGAGATPIVLLAMSTVSDAVAPGSPDALGVVGVYERVCADKGVRCVDVREAMVAARRAGVPVESLYGAHWSPELHALVAAHLDPVLEELRLAPSAPPTRQP